MYDPFFSLGFLAAIRFASSVASPYVSQHDALLHLDAEIMKQSDHGLKTGTKQFFAHLHFMTSPQINADIKMTDNQKNFRNPNVSF